MILPFAARNWFAAGCAVVCCLPLCPGSAALAPYSPDEFTLHLWHLDEPVPGVLPVFSSDDAVTTDGAVTLDIRGGARLGATSFTPGLGGALDTRGIPGSGQTPGAFAPEDLPLSQFTGSDGAFTIEALIHIGFDPAQPNINGRIDPLQIVSCDNEGANNLRPYQWRLLPPAHSENSYGAWVVEFINIAPASGVERFQLPLPETGAESLAAGAWYHTAVTFDGQPALDENLVFYWTRLGQGTQTAQVLGAETMFSALGDGIDTTPGDFAIGNTGRGTGINNFVGLIDEVRVSSVARGPGDFRLDGTPYTVDDATLHLFHFDEPNPQDFPATLQSLAFDAVSADPLNLPSLANGATFANPSFPGFGTALSTVDSGVYGTPASTDAYLAPKPLANDATDNVVLTYAGDDGAFTFEAIIRLDVELTQTLLDSARDARPLHIISGEQDGPGGGVRAWQFRIDPIGFNPNADGVTSALEEPAIEFINVNNGVAPVQNRIFLLPTSGPNAVAEGEWFHIAAAYTGEEGVEDNLSLYWTRIEATRTQADLLGTRTLETDLPLADTGIDLSIGNIGRGTPNSNFLGLIDEVRISSVARGPRDFIFSASSGVVAPVITGFTADPARNQATVTWTSLPQQTYRVQRSTDLVGWTTIATNLPGQATSTSYTDTLGTPVPPVLFYRVTTPGN